MREYLEMFNEWLIKELDIENKEKEIRNMQYLIQGIASIPLIVGLFIFGAYEVNIISNSVGTAYGIGLAICNIIVFLNLLAALLLPGRRTFIKRVGRVFILYLEVQLLGLAAGIIGIIFFR